MRIATSEYQLFTAASRTGVLQGSPMDDATFLREFLACTLPKPMWNHRAHLRIAYMLLREHPDSFTAALDAIRTGIRAYNNATGVVDMPLSGYHETVTEAWLRILADAITRLGPSTDSEAFLTEQPHLAARTLLRMFYSRERITSAEAKHAFVDSDVIPLPPRPPG